MTTEQTPEGNGKTNGKAQGPENTQEEVVYSCETPPADAPWSITVLKERIRNDLKLAEFIGGQLCLASGGDEDERRAAGDCLEKFIKPLPQELYSTCIPRDEHERLRKCTDLGMLISREIYAISPAGFMRCRRSRGLE